MVFPMPPLKISYTKYPITYCFVILNILFFMLFFAGPDLHLSSLFGDDELIEAATIVELASDKPSWFFHAKTNEDRKYIGSMALRSLKWQDWVEEVKQHEQVDAVALENFKMKHATMMDKLESHSLSQFGIGQGKKNFLEYLTYQFSHASLWHLLNNLIFLLVFGFLIERSAGSHTLMGVYILSGMLGAILFLQVAEGFVAPMVGASGAVSGLIGFYVMYEKRKNIPILFLPLVFRESQATSLETLQIYVSKWIFLPLFVLGDFSSIIAEPNGWGGGVAYWTHIGGSLSGLLIGIICRKMGHSEYIHFEIQHDSYKIKKGGVL